MQAIESSDTAQWASRFPKAPAPAVFFSGLGTTRAQAGGVEQQRKIDYDLNLELARAAKEAGVSTYVLISSGGASASSFVPYSKMKGELEEEVKKLGFTHTVILRPGLIVGDREDSRPAEFFLRKVAGFTGAVGVKDFWAQDANVIARAAVNASLQCIEGTREPGAWMIEQSGIVKLGRTEWKEPASK